MFFDETVKRPVLLVGNGVRSAGASELVYQFASATDIPVLTTMNAVDLVQDDLKIGFIGTYGNRISNIIISKCDLLISVGARLGLRQVGNRTENFAPNAKLIRADIDEFELSRTIKIDEKKYLIDAKEFLLKLINENIPKYTIWKEKCHNAKQIIDQIDDKLGNKIIEKISTYLPASPIVAVDVGQNQCWSAQSLFLKGRNGRILLSGGYGTMGCSLPFAIGASIANNKNTVFCITGDGGLQMNIQELETIAREKLPIKIFVINNYMLGKISEIQRTSYNLRYAQTTHTSGYTVPDFSKISLAYGIDALNIDNFLEYDESMINLKISSPYPFLFNINIKGEDFLIPKIEWNSNQILPRLDKKIEMLIENNFSDI